MKAGNKGKLAGVGLALTALAISVAAPAYAADTDVTVTAANLTLGAIAVGDFAGVTLDVPSTPVPRR